MTTTSSQPAAGTPGAPPGWHPDPWNPTQVRYWDGGQWTAATQAAAAPAAPRLRAPVRLLGARAVTGFALSGVLALLVVLLEVGPVGFAIGVVVALLLLPLYSWAALALDRFHPEPREALVWTFVAGGTAVFFAALFLNTTLQLLAAGVVGATAADQIGTAVVAPVVEETGKAVVLLLLYRRHRHQISGPLDGIVYAAMVGLGFATAENVLYYGRAVAEGALPVTFVVRGVFSPFAHPFFTACTGIGLGLLASGRTRRVAAPLLGLVLAITLHALWNGADVVGLGFLGVFFLFMVPTFFVVVALARKEARRERRTVAEHLRPELAAGLLAPTDLEVLGDVKARRQLLKAARALHPQAGAAARDLVADVLELAQTRERVQRGAFSEAYGPADVVLDDLAARVARARWALPPAPPAAPHAGLAGGLGLPVAQVFPQQGR